MCRLQEDPDKVTGLEAVATCVAALVPRLVVLDISSNPALLGTGVVAVCRALEGCCTLRYLRLADLKLGAKGAYSLCSNLSTYYCHTAASALPPFFHCVHDHGARPFPAIPGLVASLGPMAVPKLRQVVLTGNHLGETAVKTMIDSLTQVKFVVSDYSATIGAAVEEEEKLDVR